MLEINKFILKDVRCFKGKKEFDIRPLTFLVGENSTGKSTVLGCFQAIVQHLKRSTYFPRGEPSINFNLEPFQMGSFENIARRARPKNKEFELGFELIPERDNASKCELLVTFSEQVNGTNLVETKVHFIFDDGEIIFLNAGTARDNETLEIKIEEHNSKKIFTILLEEYQHRSFFHVIMREIYHYTRYFRYRHFREEKEELSSEVREEKEELSPEEKQFIEFIREKNFYRSLRFHFQCSSFAPIRSEPQRTYDPLSDTETSIGSEIPLILRDLSIKKPENWKKLCQKLKDFGTTSGLFTDITVRKFSSSSSDPFQLQLKIRKGTSTNLIDVGYGISQILPLLVRILTQKKIILPKHVFLMQQPEVHLHPKAQAAFISLLATLAKQKDHTFIIETHSDYMVNRACIDIMKGNIQPEDVSLIYLEAQGKDVDVHNLCFDKQGNFKDHPPDSYHDFFLSESHKLLGWKD